MLQNFCLIACSNSLKLGKAGFFFGGISPILMKIKYNTLKHNFGGDDVGVAKVIVHPEFDSMHYSNNIALVYTAADLKIDQPNLAQIPCSSVIQYGAYVRFPGWGSTREDSPNPVPDLLHMVIEYLEGACAQYHTSLGIEVDAKMFCAGNFNNGGIGLCKGDEGGAAIRANSPGSSPFRTVYGVGSFHFGCGRPYYTSIFTKVTEYRDFIKNTAGIDCVAE